MMQFFFRLRSLLHREGRDNLEEARMEGTLQQHFGQFRAVDPRTGRQWQMLKRAMVKVPADSASASSRSIPRFALAAAVVLAMLGISIYFVFSPPSPDMFATRKGEQKEVVLRDGSRVTLNHTSELVVPRMEQGAPRRISLRGEAYFSVQNDKNPFIISTEYADVGVVGTEFNVRAREGALEVAVIRGIVDVSVVHGGKDSLLQLTQNQMAVCPQGEFPRRIGNIPSPEYPGWMHGKLFLNRTSFMAACREVEMRFDITIRADDRDLQSEIITGVLNARTAESAVAALCELTGKRYAHDGQIYTVY